jgi:hypothetical protein
LIVPRSVLRLMVRIARVVLGVVLVAFAIAAVGQTFGGFAAVAMSLLLVVGALAASVAYARHARRKRAAQMVERVMARGRGGENA